MLDDGFNAWCKWKDRGDLFGNIYPGVYIIAYSEFDISTHSFSWVPEIIYIGMTNAKKGLKGRLDQFDSTLRNKSPNHGGADRVRYKHQV